MASAMQHTRMRKIRDLVPISGTALALWVWSNRDDVVEWAAFGVRSAQKLAAGETDDIKIEGRLRGSLLGDKRTRHAAGLSLKVHDGVAIFTGIVSPEVHDVALLLAHKTDGVRGVDDRLEEIRRRGPELGPA
jgi:BON domain